MTTVGIVGGLGPESTIDYYRRILEAWEREDPSTAPSIVIDSLDVGRALRLVESDRPALIEYLLGSLRRLAGAGVDFVAISANTPHIVFDELAAQSTELPLLLPTPVIAGVPALDTTALHVSAIVRRLRDTGPSDSHAAAS